ncbi:hypothetical protein R3P38DRAFT_2975644 [Favolaschia claudopus]|uniref:Protein kinase domain-containing protein n=1 Tax=Favolaschia claudopus TaxID=2862362 RepID=A0AAW0B0S3_9AGAR
MGLDSYITMASICTIALYLGWKLRSRRVSRSTLPPNMELWRTAGEDNANYKNPWTLLGPFFQDKDYTLHPWVGEESTDYKYRATCLPTSTLGRHYPRHPNDTFHIMVLLQTMVNVFISRSRCRSIHAGFQNALLCPARHKKGFDVVIKTLCAGDGGKAQLRILRKLATTDAAMKPTNHVLTMFEEIHLDDIVFGVFPFLTTPLHPMFFCSSACSAADMLNLMLQMFEATVYIHDCLVAHQDLFIDNFMCEYLPRSLADRHSMPPRVFLIDFEAAVDFPPESRPEDRLVSSHFFGDEFTRARAPELREKDTPYNPFALDIWQLGYKMSMFSTKIEAVDSIVQEMIRDEPKSRPTAKDIFDRVMKIQRSIPPDQLDYKPIDFELERGWCGDASSLSGSELSTASM